MSSGPPIAPAVLAERFLELTGDRGRDRSERDDRQRQLRAGAAHRRGGRRDRRAAADDLFIDPDDRAGLIEAWLTLTAGDAGGTEVEVRIGPAGGERRSCALGLTIDRDAGLIHLLGRDVHEQRLAASRASRPTPSSPVASSARRSPCAWSRSTAATDA